MPSARWQVEQLRKEASVREARVAELEAQVARARAANAESELITRKLRLELDSSTKRSSEQVLLLLLLLLLLLHLLIHCTQLYFLFVTSEYMCYILLILYE